MPRNVAGDPVQVGRGHVGRRWSRLGFTRIAWEPLYDNVPALGGGGRTSERRHRPGNRVHSVGDLLASLADSGLKEVVQTRRGWKLRNASSFLVCKVACPYSGTYLVTRRVRCQSSRCLGPRHPKLGDTASLRLRGCCSGKGCEGKSIPAN